MTTTDDDLDELQAFALPTGPRHPADIAARLMLTPEHRHLADNEIRIGYLMRLAPKEKAGKLELGSVHDVSSMFQGAFKDLCQQMLAKMMGFLPQFVVVIDNGAWQEFSDAECSAVIWHELCHIRQSLDKFGSPRFDRDGKPVYKIAPHDIEAFNSELRKFGAWRPDIAEFLKAQDEEVTRFKR